MAATAESSNHHSPRGTGFAGDGPNSPRHLRRSNLSSPWAQVVRGEPESTTASGSRSPPSPVASPSAAEQTNFKDCSALKSAPSSPSRSPPPDNSAVVELCDGREKSNAARSKPAWNKPSNGVIEAGAVMGAVSWPALSESTKASPKSSADSPKISDGSVSTSQAPAIPPVIPLSPNKPAASTNPNLTPNHVLPARQRSMKRGGGGGSHSGGGHSQSGFTRPPPPPPPPPFPVFRVPPNSYGTMIPPMPDSSPREASYRGSTWEIRPYGGFVPQPHMGNDHRSNSRRGNFGPRGDGSYHNNFRGRRDHDRGNYGNARDAHMPLQRGPPRGIVRAPPPPPPNTAPFIAPQTVRPFSTPIGFADVSSQLCYYPPLPMDSFRGVPFIAPVPPPPLFIPFPEPLHVLLRNQIEYYFSDANLIKDEFLKSNMDDQGWVSVTLIAGFPRVKSLTNNLQLILDSIRNSTVVEVQDDKLRRRNEWMKWIPSSGHFASESGSPSSVAASYSTLETSFQKVTVDEEKSEQSPAWSASQAQLPNGGDQC